jgi:signal transduction histidine kinase
VTLGIEDDGKGFDPSSSFPGHIGLQSMRERATRLGGTLQIESAVGVGTRILAAVPVHEP